MKQFCLLAWLLVFTNCSRAALPSFQDFLTNYFTTTGNKVGLRSNLNLTNVTIHELTVSNITFNSFTTCDSTGTNCTTYTFPVTNLLTGQLLYAITNGTNVYFAGTNMLSPNVVAETVEELVATAIPLPAFNLIGQVKDSRGGQFIYQENSTKDTNRFRVYSTTGVGRWERTDDPNIIRPEWGKVTGGNVTNDTLIAALTLQSAQNYGRVVLSGSTEFLYSSAVPLLDNNILLFEDGAQATGLKLTGNGKTNIAVVGATFKAAVADSTVPALALTNCNGVSIQVSSVSGYTAAPYILSSTVNINFFDSLNRPWTPQAFGATGKTQDDDTIPFQTMLNLRSIAGFGEVTIPAGSYRITDSLSVSNLACIRGEGRERSNLLFDPSGDNKALLNLHSAADNWIIEDIGLSRVISSLRSGISGIERLAGTGAGGRITGCRITDFNKYAIHLDSPLYVRIQDNDIWRTQRTIANKGDAAAAGIGILFTTFATTTEINLNRFSANDQAINMVNNYAVTVEGNSFEHDGITGNFTTDQVYTERFSAFRFIGNLTEAERTATNTAFLTLHSGNSAKIDGSSFASDVASVRYTHILIHSKGTNSGITITGCALMQPIQYFVKNDPASQPINVTPNEFRWPYDVTLDYATITNKLSGPLIFAPFISTSIIDTGAGAIVVGNTVVTNGNAYIYDGRLHVLIGDVDPDDNLEIEALTETGTATMRIKALAVGSDAQLIIDQPTPLDRAYIDFRSGGTNFFNLGMIQTSGYLALSRDNTFSNMLFVVERSTGNFGIGSLPLFDLDVQPLTGGANARIKAVSGQDASLIIDDGSGGDRAYVDFRSGGSSLWSAGMLQTSGYWGVSTDNSFANMKFAIERSTGKVGLGNQAGSVFYAWPSAQGGAGTMLQNDGAGTLSWAAAGATINPTDGAIPFRTNATTFSDSSLSQQSDGIHVDDTFNMFRMVWSAPSIILMADDETVGTTSSRVELSSDSAISTDRTFHLDDGLVRGQVVTLQWVDNGSAGELPSGDANVSLWATWSPSVNGESLDLIWNSVVSKWFERWRYPSTGGGITGSGTAGTIPVWLTSSSLGDSLLSFLPSAIQWTNTSFAHFLTNVPATSSFGLGDGAFQDNSGTGFDRFALGDGALKNNTGNGSDWIAMGDGAFINNTGNGNSWSLFGNYSGNENSGSGDFWVFSGDYNFKANTASGDYFALYGDHNSISGDGYYRYAFGSSNNIAGTNAIGMGWAASTTNDNQFVFGNTLNTYTLPGTALQIGGNITFLRGVPTSFPGTNAVGMLSNDGSGNLDWLPGTGGGTTINATDGTLPYRSSATAFADSPIVRLDASSVSVASLATVGAASSQGYFQGNNSGDALQPTFSFGSGDGYYHVANTHIWSEDGTQIARLIYNNSPFSGAGALSIGAGAIYFGGSPLAFTNSISSGYGTPEGALAQPEGSLYLDRTTSGGKLWVKATGTGNTGWVQLSTSTATGDFVGPPASTDNAIVRFDSTTGKLGQNSVVTISDAGAVAGVGSLAVTNGVTAGTYNGNTLTTGSSTYTGTAGKTYTMPTTSATIARTDAAQSFTGDQTFAGQIIPKAGTAAATSIGTSVSAGILFNGSSGPGFVHAGTEIFSGKNNALTVHSGTQFNWGSSALTTPDLILMRDGAATIQMGVDAATAIAQTYKAHDGSGTDKAGADLTLAGGQGTGTGTRGTLKGKNASVLTTGSSANAYTTAFGIGGTLKVDTTTTGNVGAGEDTLITYTTPAGQLSVNGDHYEFRVWGACAANTNTKDIKIYYGGTVIGDGGVTVLNGVSWSAHGMIVRTGAATQTATCELTAGVGVVAQTTTTAPAETLSGTVVFKVTGTSAISPADNDIVQNGMVLKWYPGQ